MINIKPGDFFIPQNDFLSVSSIAIYICINESECLDIGVLYFIGNQSTHVTYSRHLHKLDYNIFAIIRKLTNEEMKMIDRRKIISEKMQ